MKIVGRVNRKMEKTPSILWTPKAYNSQLIRITLRLEKKTFYAAIPMSLFLGRVVNCFQKGGYSNREWDETEIVSYPVTCTFMLSNTFEKYPEFCCQSQDIDSVEYSYLLINYWYLVIDRFLLKISMTEIYIFIFKKFTRRPENALYLSWLEKIILDSYLIFKFVKRFILHSHLRFYRKKEHVLLSSFFERILIEVLLSSLWKYVSRQTSFLQISFMEKFWKLIF